MLVLIAVIVSATLASSYVSVQGTSIQIARNVQRHAKARYIAETGLELAIAYVQATSSWRDDQSHGTWVADEAFGGGTFTIVGEDGEDTDGDGDVDGDGDLADDASDLLTLTVTGKVTGASHIARVVIRPVSGDGVTCENFAEAKASSNTTSITLSTPSGTSEGDLLIAAVVTDLKTSSSLAAPGGQGWTVINLGEGGNAVTLGVWWKIAGASESGTHQFSWGSNEQCYGWMMRFTGHDPVNPINAATSLGSGNNSSPPSPSVTTTVANTMILRLGAFDDDDVIVDSPGLAGHTAITVDGSGSGSGTCSGGAGYAQQAASGASSTSTFSLTAGEQSRAVTVAIAPDPNGGGGGGGYTYTLDWRQ